MLFVDDCVRGGVLPVQNLSNSVEIWRLQRQYMIHIIFIQIKPFIDLLPACRNLHLLCFPGLSPICLAYGKLMITRSSSRTTSLSVTLEGTVLLRMSV